MNSSITIIFLIISAFGILKSSQFSTGDFSCKTHDGASGRCVEIHECQSIHNYIKRNNYIFTQKLRLFLKERTCGNSAYQLKVCCPKITTINNIDDHYVTPDSSPQTYKSVVHKNAKLLPRDCGINKHKNIKTKTFLSKINSQKATLNEFPWMVILSYNSTDKDTAFDCVGTIINEKYILTSAICITPQLLSVRVGDHNTAETVDCERDNYDILKCSAPAEDISIEKAFRHERFQNSYTRNNIGLIRLSKPINIYTENVKAICLPLQNFSTTVDALQIPLTLTGWGVTKKNFKSEVLLKADVSVISPDDCTKAYKKVYDPKLCDNQFCTAGHPNGKRDHCIGGKGSPLQMLNGLRYTQYGIVSIGPISCVKIPIPIINTKVDRYIDWILENIEP